MKLGTTFKAFLVFGLVAAPAVAFSDHDDNNEPTMEPTPEPTPEPTESPRPEPIDVTIKSITAAGTGCQGGDVSGAIEADGYALRLSHSRFAAKVGPREPISESRKNCQAAIVLTYRAGLQFAVTGVGRDGAAELEEGASALVKTLIYFQGSADQVALEDTIAGPYTDAYHFEGTVREEALKWSSCDSERALNVNLQVRVSATERSQSGYATSEDTGEAAKIGLVWRECGSDRL